MPSETHDPGRPAATPLLSAEGVEKSFGGVRVLEGVSFEARAGEVHTLMGENGAGKSTLMKILAGVHRADAGRVVLDGREVRFGSPQEALAAGVTLIHQEPLGFPDLTVAENVLFAHGLPTRAGRVDWRETRRRVEGLMASLGVSIDPGRRMRGMSVADQQMVELAAALAGKARVLLMDEPTAALTPGEAGRLFGIVRRLKAEGVSVVFVSHRLGEVFDVSDRITVLRDGRFVGTRVVSETSPGEVVRLMVGRELSSLYQRAEVPTGVLPTGEVPTGEVPTGEVLLELRGVRRAGGRAAVSLGVRAGEIVGLAGLVGAGRTELAEAVFGLRALTAGEVWVGGRKVRVRSPRDAIAAGIAYVPEDRARHGLLLPISVAENVSLADLGAVSGLGVRSGRRERARAEVWRGRLGIRVADVRRPAGQLSGGNQQKVVLAKWLATGPRVLVVDEPTRGVDVGAKSEVHRLMAEHARAGGAVLMISSDLPEVLAVSDRVLVMRGDAVVAEFDRATATQEAVMAAATGTSPGTAPGREATGTHVDGPPARRPVPGWIRRAVSARELGVLAFLLVAVVAAAAVEPRFLSAEAGRRVALYVPLILIVAVGQLKVILSGHIDLSVGSTLGLAAIVSCGMFAARPETSLWAAAGVAVAVGAAAGLINGALVALLRVPAIIATLGTLTAYRGLIYIWSGGRQVDPDKLPESLLGLTRSGMLGLPWIVWAALATAAGAWAFLGHTVRGRQIYAIGSNPEAARLRGIPVRRVTLEVFTMSGALAGLAGILFGSRFGTVNPSSAGVQMELVTISAVVVGGAAVAGGAGSVGGTLAGCLLLGVVNVAMIMAGVSELWQLVVYGAAILAACVSDAASGRLMGRAS